MGKRKSYTDMSTIASGDATTGHHATHRRVRTCSSRAPAPSEGARHRASITPKHSAGEVRAWNRRKKPAHLRQDEQQHLRSTAIRSVGRRRLVAGRLRGRTRRRHRATGAARGEADALNYVFGYTCCNDVSARDAQFGDQQWVRGKSFDTFCPLGPWIVTADEIPDPQNAAHRVPRQRRDTAGQQHVRDDLRRRRADQLLLAVHDVGSRRHHRHRHAVRRRLLAQAADLSWATATCARSRSRRSACSPTRRRSTEPPPSRRSCRRRSPANCRS